MGYCNKRSEYNELSIITVSIIILNNKNKFNNSVIIYIVYLPLQKSYIAL